MPRTIYIHVARRLSVFRSALVRWSGVRVGRTFDRPVDAGPLHVPLHAGNPRRRRAFPRPSNCHFLR